MNIISTIALLLATLPLNSLDQMPLPHVVQMKHDNLSDLMHFSKPIILVVFSRDCHYCDQLAPSIEELNQELGNAYLFATLNYNTEPSLVNEFSVRSFPTVIFLDNGKELGRTSGFMSKETLRQEIQKYLGATTPQ